MPTPGTKPGLLAHRSAALPLSYRRSVDDSRNQRFEVLCFAVLCCAVLCCAVLCCAVRCCAVLPVLCCAVLC